MSYNITTWKTKKLASLVIPVKAFYTHERQDWHPRLAAGPEEAGVATLYCGCEQEIKGEYQDGHIHVTEFDMTGEGSGTFFDFILKPALKRSTGYLEAVIIWEGGEAIQRLKVEDGHLNLEDVEL
jgi:hypothetical protein